MIFLEQLVNQILMEEGQLIVSPLEDLKISWDMLENLFIGIYEQSKKYLNIYDWTTKTITGDGVDASDWTHIKHITYYTNYLQRYMPDLPDNYWEFNPYMGKAYALASSNYALEVGMHPTLEKLTYSTTLTLTAGTSTKFKLPCTFDLSSFSLLDLTATEIEKDGRHICDIDYDILLSGDKGTGYFNSKNLIGAITPTSSSSSTLSVTSRYVGIKELDLSCELFVTWFKAALLSMIGSMKKQIDLQGVQLPFDFNQDDLLARGRELMNKVEELKGSKSHWSNF